VIVSPILIVMLVLTLGGGDDSGYTPSVSKTTPEARPVLLSTRFGRFLASGRNATDTVSRTGRPNGSPDR
jgi:hypothetical protein